MKKKLFHFLLCCICCSQVSGQLCNGSLGDPIVNVTFGSAATPLLPLKAGVTNLGYTANVCPNDGNYTITSATSGCFGNSWHRLPSDHTGDMGGRFMLVNASPDPSEFYVDTVRGLCVNTTFEFATWVANVLKPSSCGGSGVKPNLTFRIETTTGTLLKKFDTGDIPFSVQGEWQQYGTFFKTPADISTVVLRITNNSPGGASCGNDLALDDITFRPCGPAILVAGNGAVKTAWDICVDQQTDISFAASSPDYSSPKIQWQVSTDTGKTWQDIAGETSLLFTRKPSVPGNYRYRAVMAEAVNFASVSCRVASNVTVVTINPLPLPSSGRNLTGCLGSPLVFAAAEGTGFTYQWSGPNAFNAQLRSPVIVSVADKDAGWYSVRVATAAGCSRTDSFYVSVYPGVKAGVSSSVDICEGNSTLLMAFGGTRYRWLPAAGLSDTASASPLASPTDSTLYQVLVSNQYGCSDSATVEVHVFKRPIVDAGPDKTIFEGDTVSLQGRILGSITDRYWTPSGNMQNGNTTTPLVSPLSGTTYTLTALYGTGCPVVTDEVFVRVYKKLLVPNAFSPNGDGINDTWTIRYLDTYPAANVKVFTRTGQLVFETKTGGREWDGTYNGSSLPLATYYYVIDLNVGRPMISGWVMIVR